MTPADPSPAGAAGSTPRRRGGRAGHRRADAPGTGPASADAPGTGPASADGPEPQLDGLPLGDRSSPGRSAGQGSTPTSTPAPRLSERDRWILEQKPPHWG